jgi:branched-chain amino acid transport system permease protein
MGLFFGTLVSGIAVGLLYGLLAFSIVFLFKTTGVANFAVGSMATMATFFVFHLISASSLAPITAFVLGLAAAVGLGALLYVLAIRPREDAGTINLVIRTIALYLLLFAITNRFWSEGQPFAFPSLLPLGTFAIGDVAVPYHAVGILVVAAVLSVALACFFRYTSLGLQFLAMAERPDVARLLGVRTRRLSCLAWAISGGIAAIVGVLIAPTSLLSSDMMDTFLLFAFTAAVVGGLTSLFGAFAGGVVVGCLSNLTIVYAGQDAATVVVFLLLVGTLLLKPEGIFGSPAVVRL